VRGSTYKRCPCGTIRDAQGKRINCPKKHGTWTFAHDLPPGPDGKRRQFRAGGFATEREARKAMQESIAQVKRGTWLEDSRLTVGEYLDQWLAGKARLRSSTRRSYGEHIELYLRSGLGHIRLVDLRDTDIERLYSAMRQLGHLGEQDRPGPLLQRLLQARNPTQPVRPLSDARIRRVHATLMSALNTAVRRKHIPQNPAEHVELPSGRRPKAVVWTDDRVEHWRRTGERPAVAVWTPQQTGTFLDAAMADRLYPLYHLIAYRGLRRGEAIGIQWPDVDLDAGYLRITQQVILIGWETEVAKPKTDGGERTISLDTGSVQVLRRWRERQNAERAATHGAWQHTGLVFAREDGNQLHPEHVADTFQRIYQEAGLPPIRLHDLRHTAASLALQAGVPMKVVSEQLGHSSLGITADTYTSVLPAVAQAAAEAVAGIVPRRAPEPEQADPDQTPADGRDAAAFTDRSHPASQEGPRG
jgi:integrase